MVGLVLIIPLVRTSDKKHFRNHDNGGAYSTRPQTQHYICDKLLLYYLLPM